MKKNTLACLMLLLFSLYTSSQIVQFPGSKLTEEPRKVLIHYMGWYGEGSSGRHWSDGYAHTPLIGLYNSQSWATLTYQLLLSWSCGIDGIVINVKDEYDNETMKMLMATIERIRAIDSVNFKYDFSISYDDQGMADVETAETKLTFLKNSVLPSTLNFLEYEGSPVIFIWNYNQPPFLSVADYDTALNAVFSANRPKILWNQVDTNAYGFANSFYPWVGPSAVGWDTINGLEWGHDYLNWYYPEINKDEISLDFACGAVWPGFDDRSILDTAWNQNRWMERLDGAVYDSTWLFANDYSGDLPLKWVYIETWNDWNEGSEIEPSVEDGYRYLESTVRNINDFKETSIDDDTCMFYAARKIYEASGMIELNQERDSANYYPALECAIESYLGRDCSGAIGYANSIISGSPDICAVGISEIKTFGIEVYPNPVIESLTVELKKNDTAVIQIIRLDGYTVFSKEVNTLNASFDLSRFPKGIYLVRVMQENNRIEKKISIQ